MRQIVGGRGGERSRLGQRRRELFRSRSDLFLTSGVRLLFPFDLLAARSEPRCFIRESLRLGGESVPFASEAVALGATLLGAGRDSGERRPRAPLPLPQLGEPRFPIGLLPAQIFGGPVQLRRGFAMLGDPASEVFELAAKSEDPFRRGSGAKHSNHRPAHELPRSSDDRNFRKTFGQSQRFFQGVRERGGRKGGALRVRQSAEVLERHLPSSYAEASESGVVGLG